MILKGLTASSRPEKYCFVKKAGRTSVFCRLPLNINVHRDIQIYRCKESKRDLEAKGKRDTCFSLLNLWDFLVNVLPIQKINR